MVDPVDVSDLVDPVDLVDLVDPIETIDASSVGDRSILASCGDAFERDPASKDPELRSGIDPRDPVGASDPVGGRQRSFSLISRSDPPTFEQWSRLPWVIRWHIFLVILAYCWESWLADIGLRLGGAR